MFRLLAVTVLATIAACAPFPVSAQRPGPDPATLAALSGTWRVDSVRTQPMPVMPTGGRMAPRPAGAGGVAGGGGGGGRGRGRSGGGIPSGGTDTPSAEPASPRPGRGGPGGGYLRQLFAEMASPDPLVVTISDTAVVLANAAGAELRWVPDGRVRQHAQLDGTLLENSAQWHGDKLQVQNGVHGTADLKRSLRLIDKGQALELKLELSGPAVPRKVSRTVVYVR